MRRTLLTALAVILLAAACTTRKTEPTPEPSKERITAQVVMLCVEPSIRKRYEDHWCDGEGTDGYQWVYVPNVPTFPADLPAVGEYLQGGQLRFKPEPGQVPERIPAHGALFSR